MKFEALAQQVCEVASQQWGFISRAHLDRLGVSNTDFLSLTSEDGSVLSQLPGTSSSVFRIDSIDVPFNYWPGYVFVDQVGSSFIGEVVPELKAGEFGALISWSAANFHLLGNMPLREHRIGVLSLGTPPIDSKISIIPKLGDQIELYGGLPCQTPLSLIEYFARQSTVDRGHVGEVILDALNAGLVTEAQVINRLEGALGGKRAAMSFLDCCYAECQWIA